MCTHMVPRFICSMKIMYLVLISSILQMSNLTFVQNILRQNDIDILLQIGPFKEPHKFILGATI